MSRPKYRSNSFSGLSLWAEGICDQTVSAKPGEGTSSRPAWAIGLPAMVHCSGAKLVLHQFPYGIEIDTAGVSYLNYFSVGADDGNYADSPAVASAIAIHVVDILPCERHWSSIKHALPHYARFGDKGGGVRDESDKNDEGRKAKGNREKEDCSDNSILDDCSVTEELDNLRKPPSEDRNDKNQADTAHKQANRSSCNGDSVQCVRRHSVTDNGNPIRGDFEVTDIPAIGGSFSGNIFRDTFSVGTPACRSADRACLNSTRSSKRAHYAEALRALGSGTAVTTGSARLQPSGNLGSAETTLEHSNVDDFLLRPTVT